ncbi:MAG: inorganic phosphate transporter, partial [Kaistella sp.]
FGKIFGIIVPESIMKRYNASFEEKKLLEATRTVDTPAFDLVRAATNLVLASIIIAWATSEKLPLSTTYVTFMVAMGSSLADRAWGRDSAVYRVAGVLSVIGGWFITAFIAFTVAALFALILYKGEQTGTLILLAVVCTYIIISHIRFSKREEKSKKSKDRLKILENEDMNTVQKYQSLISATVSEIATSYNLIIEGLIDGDITKLEQANKAMTDLEEHGYNVRNQSIKYIKSLAKNDKQTAQTIIFSSDFIQDLSQSTKFLSDLKTLDEKMSHFFNLILVSLEQTESENIETIRKERDEVRSYINDRLDFQISNINKMKPSTKEGVLQTNVFLQSRDIQAVLTRISKMFLKLYETRMTKPSN